MKPTYQNQRYYALWQYNRARFGERVMKAVIDGGFTCPNKDGMFSTKGCLFCDGGSGYFTGTGTISEQLAAECRRIHGKFPAAPIIAYFQSNTNTYAPVDVLRSRYEEALAFPGVMGLSIGTRADCIGEDVLALLKELNRRTYLTVEIGVQTMHAHTAQRLNLCCTREMVEECVHRLRENGIRTCLHLINGLPGESEEDMVETARIIGGWYPDAVKIQMLHIIEGTPMAALWEQEKMELLQEEAYVRITARQLEYLPPTTVCERLTGDGDAAHLLAPEWTRRKMEVLNRIAQYQKEQNSWQGMRFEETQKKCDSSKKMT